MRMLSASLRRNAGNGSLQDFKKRLLYAFAGHVAGNGNIFCLFGDLVDLINVNNAVLRTVYIVISRLDQL